MKAVSYAEVHSALAQLVSRKEPITLSTLRQALGNRGSMSTLSKHLQRWKHEQALTDLSPGAINPAPEPILAAVQGVWQQIFEKGQQELVEQKEAFEKHRAILEETTSLAKNQAEAANKESAELRQKIQHVLNQCQELQEQTRQAQNQQQLAEQRASQAEKNALEIQKTLDQAMKNLQQYQEQIAQQYEKDQLMLMREKEDLKKEYQAIIEQEKKFFVTEQEKWQKSYFDLQQRCAQFEILLNQGPSIEKITDLIQQLKQQSERDKTSLKEQIQNMEKTLTQTSIAQITQYQRVTVKGYC